jgi:DNA polymerase-3 subunit gamma/tau
VPTDPGTGKATIGGRARRDAPRQPAGGGDAPPTAPRQQDGPKAAATVAAVDDADIPGVFEKEVRPVLRGMAKAIYMGAHVGGMHDGKLTVGFAGEPHRVRAEEYRVEVERALARVVGRTIALALVVDVTGGSQDDNVLQLKRAPQPPPDEEVDTTELTDVPPEAVLSPIDRLTQAFPGSEIIEEHT